MIFVERRKDWSRVQDYLLNMQNKAVQRCKRIIMQMVKGEAATWIYTSMENMNEQKRVAMEHAAMTNGSLRRLSALLKGMARDSSTSPKTGFGHAMMVLHHGVPKEVNAELSATITLSQDSHCALQSKDSRAA